MRLPIRAAHSAIFAALGAWCAACSSAVAPPPLPLPQSEASPPIAVRTSPPPGGEMGAPALALSDAIAFGLSRSPGLRAVKERWFAAQKRTGAVTLPPPELEYAYAIAQTDSDHMAGFSQAIPWPGRLEAQAAAWRAEADVAGHLVEIKARDLVAEITVAFHALRYSRRAEAIYRENLALAEKLARLADAARTPAMPESEMSRAMPLPRSVTLLDALKAQAQLAQLQNELLVLAESRKTAEAQLNRLLGRPADAALGVPDEPADVALTAAPHDILRLALAQRQELQAAAAEAHAAALRRDAAELIAVPDLKFGVEYRHMIEGTKEHELALRFGVMIPLWGGFGADAEAETHLMRAALAEREQQALDLAAELTAAQVRYARAKRLAKLYRGVLLPQAVTAMRQIETAFAQGGAAFGEVLEAQAAYLGFALALERARTEVFESLARIEQLVGAPLNAMLAEEKTP